MKVNWKVVLAVGTSILTGILILKFYSGYADQYIEPLLIKKFFLRRAEVNKVEPPNEVIIVGVDEASRGFARIGKKEVFPRKYYTQLLHLMADYGARGVLFDFGFSEPDPDPSVDVEFAKAMRLLPVVLPRTNYTIKGETTESRPIPIFREQAAREAWAVVHLEDGVVRKFPDFKEPTLGLAAARMLKNVDWPSKNDYLNFYGPEGTIKRESIADVLSDPGLKWKFKDKVVFVGDTRDVASSTGGIDRLMTPVDYMYGVEIHATIADNLITSGWLKRFPVQKEHLNLLLAASLCALVILSIGRWTSVPACLLIISSWIYGSYQAFLHGYYWPGSISIIVPFLFVLVLKQAWESEFSIRLVCRFVPKAVGDGLCKVRGLPTVGGESKFVTTSFTDVAGFSGISQNITCDELFKMLSGYFNAIYPEAEKNGGTVLQYVGDALVIIYGAPKPIEDSPDHAMKAAIGMQTKIKEYCEKNHLPMLKTRVGIHYGEVSVGYYGYHKHVVFTAMGDTMNVGARLEALCKYFDAWILTSGETKAMLKEEYFFVRVGLVQLAGRKGATEVWANFLKQITQEQDAAFQYAWKLFSEKKWTSARREFQRIAKTDPDFKKASEFYIRQIHLAKYNKLPAGWAGEINVEKNQDEEVGKLLGFLDSLKLELLKLKMNVNPIKKECEQLRSKATEAFLIVDSQRKLIAELETEVRKHRN